MQQLKPADICSCLHAFTNPPVWCLPYRSAAQFFADMHRVLRYASLGPVKSFCHHRLMLLEQKFNLHVMLNADKEFLAQKSAPHRCCAVLACVGIMMLLLCAYAMGAAYIQCSS